MNKDLTGIGRADNISSPKIGPAQAGIPRRQRIFKRIKVYSLEGGNGNKDEETRRMAFDG
jgi:hypothetical protein